ncbi:hypothetical protein BDZ91DRAFT_802723 [Kalaharituber pfeilii]|nr:hypothetical protein BDZ91DRAFT_802723 [Kalaharituber pfeilii]
MASSSGALDAYSLTDISPESYLTWTKFTFPDGRDGKTAIAVSESHARMITALYTILIAVIFSVIWDMLLSLIVFVYTPKRMTRTNYITMITSWNSSDHLHAIPVLLEHALKVFWDILRNDNVMESTWKSFGLDVVILLLALGGWGGSLAMGLKFPDLLIIGSAAPVNPASVFYPDFHNKSLDARLANAQYSRETAARAFAGVEGYEGKIEQFVNLTISDRINTTNDSGEERYKIYYSYTVSGLDMGLQHLSHLTLHVQGQCNFEDSWYNKSMSGWYNKTEEFDGGDWEFYSVWPKNESDIKGLFELYSLRGWVPISRRQPPSAKFRLPQYTITSGNNTINLVTGRSYYSIMPSTASRFSFTASKDAWYATQNQSYFSLAELYPYEVKNGRPPLNCWEDNDWSYKSWRGTMANLIGSGDDELRAPVTLPLAIEVILSTQLAIPIIANLGMTNPASALKSANQATSPDNAIDAKSTSAATDMRRLILASFLATRDIFRAAVIAGTASASIKSSNILTTADGGYLEGTGDFIVVSRTVVALDFTQMIVVPATLACLLLIAVGLRLARKMTKLEGKPGRFRRFALYASGLQASQLYRLLDQALAGSGREPVWSNETGLVPFVSSSSPTDLPVPELQVATNDYGNGPRMVMGLRDQPPDQFGHPASSYFHDLSKVVTNSTEPASPEASPKATYTVELTEVQADIMDRKKHVYDSLTQEDYQS